MGSPLTDNIARALDLRDEAIERAAAICDQIATDARTNPLFAESLILVGEAMSATRCAEFIRAMLPKQNPNRTSPTEGNAQ